LLGEQINYFQLGYSKFNHEINEINVVNIIDLNNSSSPMQSSSGQSTLASLPMIGSDNDDFALSASVMPGSSSTQTVIPQSIPISTAKSTTLESDSSSSSSSSDSSSSDYETENVISVPTGINGE